MKKLLVLGVFGISSLVLAGTCFAASPYFSGNFGFVSVSDADLTNAEFAGLGISNVEISFDNGVGLSLAAGADTGVVRVEGEFSYRKNDMDDLSASFGGVSDSTPLSGEIESMALMGNVIKDFNTDSVLTPFLGLGLGFTKLDAEIEGDSEDDTVFAYQLILGTGINVSETTSIDLSYRYFAAADPDFDGTELEYGTHNFMIGARFDF
jgi:opacity protein-like surface antigen